MANVFDLGDQEKLEDRLEDIAVQRFTTPHMLLLLRVCPRKKEEITPDDKTHSLFSDLVYRKDGRNSFVIFSTLSGI
jgi:hypothetical protein